MGKFRTMWNLNQLFDLCSIEFVAKDTRSLEGLREFLANHRYRCGHLIRRKNLSGRLEYFFSVSADKPIIDILISFHRTHPQYYLNLDNHVIDVWRQDEENHS